MYLLHVCWALLPYIDIHVATVSKKKYLVMYDAHTCMYTTRVHVQCLVSLVQLFV